MRARTDIRDERGVLLYFRPQAGAWIVPDGWRGGAALEAEAGGAFRLRGVNTGVPYLVTLELTGRKVIDGRVRVRVVFADGQTSPAWAVVDDRLFGPEWALEGK